MGDCSPMQLHSGTRDIGVRFDSKTNGTGAIRQFVSKATRLSSRVAFCYLRLVQQPPIHPLRIVPTLLATDFVLFVSMALAVAPRRWRVTRTSFATKLFIDAQA